MPKYIDVKPALVWRYQRYSLAHALGEDVLDDLVESLSVEGAPYSEIPEKLWPSVNAFRHLRTDARRNAARRYLREMNRR